MADKEAFAVELNDKKEYQRLFQAPESCGMKAGRVWLAPGQECGLHSTEAREECLVFLAGQGTAVLKDKKIPVGYGRACYIPPHTEHNIVNTGGEPLVYIFCVAPVAG